MPSGICQVVRDLEKSHRQIRVYDALGVRRERLGQNRRVGCDDATGTASVELREFHAVPAHRSPADPGDRETGDRYGQAQALKYLGLVRANTGVFDEAGDLLLQALTIHREIGSRSGQVQTLNQIGTVRLATGAPDQALRMFTDALDLAHDIGSQHEQARALEGAARSHAGLGDTDTARTHLREAIDIYRRIGASETDTAATYLTTLESR